MEGNMRKPNKVVYILADMTEDEIKNLAMIDVQKRDLGNADIMLAYAMKVSEFEAKKAAAKSQIEEYKNSMFDRLDEDIEVSGINDLLGNPVEDSNKRIF